MNPTADDIVQAVPAEHRRNANRLIEACQLVITGGFQPGEITAIIGIAGDYGPWLEDVRQAIRAADLTETDRAALLAAFNMATVVLSQFTDRREVSKSRFI